MEKRECGCNNPNVRDYWRRTIFYKQFPDGGVEYIYRSPHGEEAGGYELSDTNLRARYCKNCGEVFYAEEDNRIKEDQKEYHCQNPYEEESYHHLVDETDEFGNILPW